MATLDLDITGGLKPDSSGEVFWQPYKIIDTGAVIDPLVLCFNNSGTKDGAAAAFKVPQNYVGTAKIIVEWNANATTGNGTLDLSYLARSDGEDMGAAATDTTDTVTTTTDGTAFNLNTSSMTLTSGDFAAGDIVAFEIFRDTITDTMAATMMVWKIVFQYSDA